MLTAIISFLQVLPSLIGILKQIWITIQNAEEEISAREKAKQINEALKKANETKDTGDLEKQFDPNRTYNCPNCGKPTK